jgi:hypothetical protein
MRAKLFVVCLVLGALVTGVRISATDAMDEHAMLARIHIDWTPLTDRYFRVSEVHIGESEFRVDAHDMLVYDALIFTLEAKAAFQWYNIPAIARFYDADDRALLPDSYTQFDPSDLTSTGWLPGTRCRASVSLSAVDLAQVKTIRFLKGTEDRRAIDLPPDADSAPHPVLGVKSGDGSH